MRHRASPDGHPVMRDRRGFALVAVLLVLALLGVIGAEFAYSMRLEASSMRAWKDGLTGAHLAEAAIEQAIREIAGDFALVSIADDGVLTFFTRDRIPLPRPSRIRVPFGPGEFSYEITDEQSRLNINSLQAERIDRLLQCMRIDKVERDKISDAILDWVDTNEEHRANGAESDDYYLTLPTPYRARNGPLESINELLQIKGITQAVFNGADGRPGLVDVLTVRTPGGQVNVNTAVPVVLCGLGVSDAQISEIMQERVANGPYPAVPGRLGGQGFIATTQTFRIEAEGLVNGRSRARITAIVQKRTGPANPIVTLEWSGIR